VPGTKILESGYRLVADAIQKTLAQGGSPNWTNWGSTMEVRIISSLLAGESSPSIREEMDLSYVSYAGTRPRP